METVADLQTLMEQLSAPGWTGPADGRPLFWADL